MLSHCKTMTEKSFCFVHLLFSSQHHPFGLCQISYLSVNHLQKSAIICVLLGYSLHAQFNLTQVWAICFFGVRIQSVFCIPQCILNTTSIWEMETKEWGMLMAMFVIGISLYFYHRRCMEAKDAIIRQRDERIVRLTIDLNGCRAENQALTQDNIALREQDSE